MPYITIPSVLRPTERAYKLTRSGTDNYGSRGQTPLLENITEYDTYGDDTVQHSTDWCSQFHNLTDVCVSLATAILAEPKREEWQWLTHLLHYWSDSDIDFALSVKHKEGKVQYYSRELKKVTTADKQHDRRYTRVQPWNDGTPGAAFSLLVGECRYDSLYLVHLAMRLHDRMSDTGQGYFSPQDIWTPLKELKDADTSEWRSAYQALFFAIDAVRKLDATARSLECIDHNLKNEAERANAAAAAAA